MDVNVSAWTDEQRKNLDIERLPRNICEAVDALEADAFITGVMGDALAKQYVDAKRKEWDVYRRHVTEWEIGEYLNRY